MILDLAVPRNVRKVRRILGIIGYYRDLWPERSRTLAPLYELVRTENDGTKNKNKKETKKNNLAKVVWTDIHETAFSTMKKIVAREALLAYPDFERPFIIHTDACDIQLGSVISQNKKPLAFYSRKLNAAQKNYTTREKELLSIVETLKEFNNILFGHEVVVHTDHKNLTHETELVSSPRVMRWRLLLEEYKISLKYIKGCKNIFADCLSRAPTVHDCPTDDVEKSTTEELLALVPDEKFVTFPMETKKIRIAQQSEIKNNRSFRKKIIDSPEYEYKKLQDTYVLFKNKKIYVPKKLRHDVLVWYHHFLCHPGATRLEMTLSRTMVWPGMSQDCKIFVRVCDTCQCTKKGSKKYGHLPAKKAEDKPGTYCAWTLLARTQSPSIKKITST